jgi:anthranilate phosphoribosyltransferase
MSEKITQVLTGNQFKEHKVVLANGRRRRADTVSGGGGVATEQVTGNRDVSETDRGKILEVTATATLNCPNGVSEQWQMVVASFSGTTTITADGTLKYLDGGEQAAGSGVVVNSQCTLYHQGSDIWVVLGDVTPV